MVKQRSKGFESKARNKITVDGDCYILGRQESPSSINQISS